MQRKGPGGFIGSTEERNMGSGYYLWKGLRGSWKKKKKKKKGEVEGLNRIIELLFMKGTQWVNGKLYHPQRITVDG